MRSRCHAKGTSGSTIHSPWVQNGEKGSEHVAGVGQVDRTRIEVSTDSFGGLADGAFSYP